MSNSHVPVMEKELLSFFADQRIHVFFDGTLGAGGHARALLEAHPEIERYIGCDRDPEALAIAKKNLIPWKEKVEFIYGSFAKLDHYLQERKIQSVEGFFLTLECHLCN